MHLENLRPEAISVCAIADTAAPCAGRSLLHLGLGALFAATDLTINSSNTLGSTSESGLVLLTGIVRHSQREPSKTRPFGQSISAIKAGAAATPTSRSISIARSIRSTRSA